MHQQTSPPPGDRGRPLEHPAGWFTSHASEERQREQLIATARDSAAARRLQRCFPLWARAFDHLTSRAIVLVAEQLEMTNPRRPRFAYCISDGGWYDTEAGVQKIRWLAEHGVPTIHLSIGTAPLSVECDRITVISDPAQALDHIAADTVDALKASSGGRR